MLSFKVNVYCYILNLSNILSFVFKDYIKISSLNIKVSFKF